MKTVKYFSRLIPLFTLLLFFSSILFGDGGSNDSCNGEQISELHSISSTISRTESGTLYDGAGTDDDNDYYYFKPGVAGKLSISYTSNYSTDLYISNVSCGDNRVLNNGTSYSNTNITVTSAQTIYIRIKREIDNKTTTYSLPMTFTIAPQNPPIMNDIPDHTARVGTPISLKASDYVTLTDGDPVIAYKLTGTLPAWLSFNTTTGVFSGTPTAVALPVAFSIIAVDNDGESTADNFTITVSPPLTETIGGRDFTQRTQENLFGDVRVIGNTVLCILSSGSCVEPTSITDSNADTNLQKAPVSYSTLTLDANATVEYARIYWQGRKAESSSWDAASKAAAGTIGLRKGSTGAFSSLSADIKDFDTTSNIPIYSASADASSVVNGSGTYYIDAANFYTLTGDTSDGLGAYGAWVLVVIYKDPNETSARNITIFDGYKQITKDIGSIDVSVSGFLSPRAGPVDSKAYVFAAEGDKYITGDRLKMAGATYNTTLQDLNGSNAFDSRVNVDGVRSPNLTNNNGIDIHKYDVGTTSGAKNIITNNETGAKFQFTSTQDTYFPSLIVFSAELYLPQMCYDYSIRQDGRYLDVDRDAYPVARLDSTVSDSDLEIVVYLKNIEADIAAEGIALKADVNDTIFDQIGNIYTSNVNGSSLIDRGAPTLTTLLCDYDENGDNSLANNGCTNGHDIRKGNGSLDAGQYIYTKYKLSPKNVSGLGEIDEPLGLSLRYYITAGGNKIVYPDYLLGGVNIPLCPPTGSYTPTWGQFNVVKSGQDNDDIKNNLNTQISRNPFDVAVVFDSTPSTGNNQAPASDIATTVLVEIIDIDSFGDINASCSNPDSSLSTPIFVPINFTPGNYQANVPSQDADYYNFAVKNAAFRVWYFNDSNGSLIQDWSAATLNNNKTLSGISNLYNSATHAYCATSCSDSTSVNCFNCIKANYAQPLCSRDNFSIRPESYDLRIFDVNKKLPDYNIKTDPSNLKNTTKIDLTTQYGYSPLTSPSSRMSIAAGYNYRFDITATGHNGISAVPGYTRYFNGAPEYKATLFWDPQSSKTGCNSTSDREDIPFYVANGIMQNEERFHSEVGEYRLNLIDNSWTAVDSSNMSHHDTSVSGAFSAGEDCILNSTSSALAGGRYGCTISTNHGSDGGGRIYKDHDLTFHPYWFDMNGIVASYGENNKVVFDGNASIYMANISTEEQMSLHFRGNVDALAENNSTLSNFVDNCYAKPVDLKVLKSNIVFAPALTPPSNYKFRFHNVDIATNDINGTMNNTTGTISLGTNDFNQSNNGRVNTNLNMNFDRNVTNFLNPQQITFDKYTSECTTTSDCEFSADLTTKSTVGSRDLNQTVDTNEKMTIKHHYGRTHASKQRYDGNTGPANIYFEVYCFGTVGGNTCNKLLLPNGINSKRINDARWFMNENHDITNDGSVGIVLQRSGANVAADKVDATDNPLGNPSVTTLNYDGSSGYPYKTTMQNEASSWLIYNENDPTATRNEFQVEFDSSSGWSGAHDTNTTTKNRSGTTTNRRVIW
ncbi:MAG: Ig domain-containing protein [Sulfurimonas sp.]|jgi:hypothetical protein